MGSTIKFTVIIPTRERADVLFHSLRTVVAQDYDDLTIIVSDNFSQDNTRQVVESFRDSRIKYVNTGKRLSMSHNYEFALSHVHDGWVAIIGDDDGLLPGALTTVAGVIRKTGCQAVISDVCRYNWPGTQTNENGLVVPLDQGFEWRNCRAWLKRVMNGEASYMDLPYLYTGGFVHSEIINKARSSKGTFYFSLNPDVYSAVAIASVLDNYVMLRESVAVAGMSSHSIGGSALGIEKSKQPAQKFFSEGNIPFDTRLINKDWPQEIPKSGPIFAYECYLQTERIHSDFLNVQMADQLGMALSRCPKSQYEDLRKYCVEIAEKNGLTIQDVDLKEKFFQRWQFLNDFREKVYRSFHYRVLSGKEFGIHDVYEASILARAVFLLETRYAGWRFKKIFQGIKKLFRRCS